MGLIKFTISLDHLVYYPGQTISGKLLVGIDKPMSMKGIYLKYSGKGTVRWTETRRRNNQNYTEIYWNSENYLELQQLVYGNDADDCELPTGEHIFIFNCQLPINMPSSFEGAFGRIRYSVKATINRPWKTNHVTAQPITVISILDLNRHSFAAVPIAEKRSKTFFGSSKQLFMDVNIPVRGFVPGQIIPIKVFLNNESKVQVKSIYVSLKQNIIFHATNKSRAVKMYVFQNEFPVQIGSGREEHSLNLQLPAVPPSYLEFSRIIDLNYQLNVTAKANTWYHKDLKIPMEIIVGNIPLMSYQIPIPPAQQYSFNEQTNQGSFNPSYGQTAEHQPPTYGSILHPGTIYGDLPPPTYEQSMGLVRSGEEKTENYPDSDGEVTVFSPLYPVYKFESVGQTEASV